MLGEFYQAVRGTVIPVSSVHTSKLKMSVLFEECLICGAFIVYRSSIREKHVTNW
jgi:hypothetical protein